MNADTQSLPAIATVEDPASASPAERSNILIVDDRLDKRVVFRTILEELDQNIVTASLEAVVSAANRILTEKAG